MDFLALSLPEAAYLYMGLAMQALVRSSSLRQLPRVMVLGWTLVLIWRAQGRPGGYRTVWGYVGACLVLLILFWPEAVPFGRLAGRTTDPTQVASYAASQDPGAEIVTAEDTGQVAETLRNPTLLAPGFRLLLRAITETPLALARTINSQAHRTFASVMPMQWLLGVDLTADVTSAVADWVHNCYLPVQTGTMEGQEGRTIEELLPWGDTPMRRGLTTREVVPGAQTGISWLRGPNTSNTVRCDTYLDAVEFRTQAWLFELKSPRGTPLLEVFQHELGLDSQQQARFLVYREMLRATGPAVPAPSLTGTYGLLRGLSALGAAGGDALGGAASQGLSRWQRGLGFVSKATGIAAGAGAAQGLADQFQRMLDGLSWWVGIAAFLTWWGPSIVGIINLLIGLFPFVMLWALIPGTQFLPLAEYFVALLLTSSVPLWWALVDQAQQLAAANAPQSTDLLLGFIGNWAPRFLWSTVTTVLGILIIPVVCGVLFFATFRAVGGLWRGAA